jgi:hypothetical protein
METRNYRGENMQKVRNLAKVTAAMSLACGIAVAAAGPALAASPNEAYAAQATGVISAGPLDEATFPGTSPVTALSANIAGLLTAGVITDTADATSASATIANAGVTLAPALGILSAVGLTADAVTSSCTFNANTATVTGTSGITNGAVNGGGLLSIALAANPAPNTTISVPGIATLTLNRQTVAGDGTLTVDAIYVSLLGSTQTLTVGTSVCNTATLAGAPALPGMATPIGATLAGLAGFGGIGYFLSKRRRVASQG